MIHVAKLYAKVDLMQGLTVRMIEFYTYSLGSIQGYNIKLTYVLITYDLKGSNAYVNSYVAI